jgi:hypothetical protein
MLKINMLAKVKTTLAILFLSAIAPVYASPVSYPGDSVNQATYATGAAAQTSAPAYPYILNFTQWETMWTPPWWDVQSSKQCPANYYPRVDVVLNRADGGVNAFYAQPYCNYASTPNCPNIAGRYTNCYVSGAGYRCPVRTQVGSSGAWQPVVVTAMIYCIPATYYGSCVEDGSTYCP